MLTGIVISFILLGLLWVAVCIFRLFIELFPLWIIVIMAIIILSIFK